MNADERRFFQLAKALQIPKTARRQLWREIETRHGEPHRAYHNLTHLQEMFVALGKLCADGVPTAVSLAVFFHDIVYDPKSSSNEADSAAMAAQLLGDWLDSDLLNELRRLILLTKTHQAGAGDENGRILLDADLAILGAPPHRYRAYAAAIRQEYAHVPEESYRVGRTAVLTHFLHMPTIYKTAYAQDRWEAQARENLMAERQFLKM